MALNLDAIGKKILSPKIILGKMSSFMPWVLVQAFLIMKVKLCVLVFSWPNSFNEERKNVK